MAQDAPHSTYGTGTSHQARNPIVSSSSSSSEASATDDPSESSRPSRSRLPRITTTAGHSTEIKGRPPRRRSSSKSMSYATQIGPSRGHLMSSMPGPMDPANEITYTPTTRRISKAKKGKKVHKCEFGCGKIFTRAEHRKRHEANHRPDPLFRCQVEDCRKPFQRADLLTRHLERQHDIHSPVGTPKGPRRRRTSSPASSVAGSGQAGSPPANFIAGRPTAASMSTATHPSSTISIESLIEPNTRHHYAAQHWQEISHLPVGSIPRHLPQDLLYSISASDESPFYSSDSCYSPMSECPQARINNQPYLPQYHKTRAQSTTSFPTDYQSQILTNPMPSVPTYTSWHGFEAVTQPNNGLGIGFENPFPAPVGCPHLATPTPVQFPGVDGYGWDAIRPELHDTTSVAHGWGNSMVNLDDETKQHYYECYRRHFHPLFPIVHYPAFLSSESPIYLAAVILAIGAQFSARPNSAYDSISMHSVSLKSLPLQSIMSSSTIADLQTVFLLETIELYRGRSPRVNKSPRFDQLYSCLASDRPRLGIDSAVFLHSLPSNATPDQIRHAHRLWADVEARRRLLGAAFVLDTQHCTFFHQPHCVVLLESLPQHLPRICPQDIWDCPNLVTWLDLLRTLVTVPSLSINSSLFHSTLHQCVSLFTHPQLQHHPAPPLPSSHIHVSLIPVTFTSFALRLFAITPLKSLILTAGESWLFSRKTIDREAWMAAKIELRAWVDGNLEDCMDTRGGTSKEAVRYAVRVLRMGLEAPEIDMGNKRQECKGSEPTSFEFGLHAEWCLYVAGLVCWAFAFSPLNTSRNLRSQLRHENDDNGDEGPREQTQVHEQRRRRGRPSRRRYPSQNQQPKEGERGSMAPRTYRSLQPKIDKEKDNSRLLFDTLHAMETDLESWKGCTLNAGSSASTNLKGTGKGKGKAKPSNTIYVGPTVIGCQASKVDINVVLEWLRRRISAGGGKGALLAEAEGVLGRLVEGRGKLVAF